MHGCVKSRNTSLFDLNCKCIIDWWVSLISFMCKGDQCPHFGALISIASSWGLQPNMSRLFETSARGCILNCSERILCLWVGYHAWRMNCASIDIFFDLIPMDGLILTYYNNSRYCYALFGPKLSTNFYFLMWSSSLFLMKEVSFCKISMHSTTRKWWIAEWVTISFNYHNESVHCVHTMWQREMSELFKWQRF